MSSLEIRTLCSTRINQVNETTERLMAGGVLRESRKTHRLFQPPGGGRPTDVYYLTKRDTLLVASYYDDDEEVPDELVPPPRIIDGVYTISTVEIAQRTGKKHFHVMRDARAILGELGLDASKFGSVYRDRKGEERPCLHLRKREVEILTSGYSVPLRAAIIDRWHELEEQLSGPKLPQSLPEALRLAADLAEKNGQQQAVITQQTEQIVLRDTRTMLEAMNIDALKFEGSYRAKDGSMRPCFNLPEREWLILTSGWSIPLRDIDEMLDRLGIDRLRFQLMYPDTYGRPQRCFHLRECEPVRAAAI